MRKNRKIIKDQPKCNMTNRNHLLTLSNSSFCKSQIWTNSKFNTQTIKKCYIPYICKFVVRSGKKLKVVGIFVYQNKYMYREFPQPFSFNCVFQCHNNYSKRSFGFFHEQITSFLQNKVEELEGRRMQFLEPKQCFVISVVLAATHLPGSYDVIYSLKFKKK